MKVEGMTEVKVGHVGESCEDEASRRENQRCGNEGRGEEMW